MWNLNLTQKNAWKIENINLLGKKIIIVLFWIKIMKFDINYTIAFAQRFITYKLSNDDVVNIRILLQLDQSTFYFFELK